MVSAEAQYCESELVPPPPHSGFLWWPVPPLHHWLSQERLWWQPCVGDAAAFTLSSAPAQSTREGTKEMLTETPAAVTTPAAPPVQPRALLTPSAVAAHTKGIGKGAMGSAPTGTLMNSNDDMDAAPFRLALQRKERAAAFMSVENLKKNPSKSSSPQKRYIDTPIFQLL